MRFSVCVCIAFAAAAALPAAINVGDPYKKVLQEMGRPSGSIEAGTTLSLHYPGRVIKLDRGRVVAIEAVAERAAPGDDAPRPATRAVAVPEKSSRPVVTAESPKPRGHSPPANTLRRDPARTTVPAGRWTTEYGAALLAAKEQKCRVLLFFTGSDWSSGCMQLRHEIFSTPAFLRYASEHLILVEVDFPKRRKLAPALKAQNDALKRQYGIHQFPIVVVLDSEGQQLGMLGYTEGGPQAFVAELKKL